MEDVGESKRNTKRRKPLLLGVIAAVLLACAITTGLGASMISSGPAVSSMWSGFLKRVGIEQLIELGTDEELAKLSEALAQRWDPDPAIPSAGMGLETYASSDNPEPEIWLTIELSYKGACDPTPNDPCEALVDELAHVVFDNYARVDELTGIRISITNYESFGVVEFSDTLIDKALTIEEWRRELSIEDEESAIARTCMPCQWFG